ncbi:DegT/DnrJ/EryC1/StrS family aminotransferase [Flammeovirgaceae bacterium SG7u.111]|nr:DegT/DnrJ/EryC1/StrS family aminotransferase [Flammeovirgaceae bacterium SG7u.132]WPO35457.1 DegT/DnrJ/EryC1/StrS family aminotransferase [Flammeovirgaceae bacterium SG7u.111]
MNKKIPFFSLGYMHGQCAEELKNAFERVLGSSSFLLGKELEVFEENFAKYIGTKHCVGVNSGTDALLIALKALELEKGAEVVLPAHTFISSVLAVIHAGLKPVLADVDEKTYNLDNQKIEEFISSKTQVLMSVHLYGQPCQIDKLMQLAKVHKLTIIEDNAQAQGSVYEGQKTGSFGLMSATSFYPSKNIGAMGDAGAITTDSEVLSQKMKVLRNVGMGEKYIHNEVGVNSRMDEIQAAVLKVKLGYLEEWNEERIKIAKSYTEGLGDMEELVLPFTLPKTKHVFHQYVIRTERREELRGYLEKNGIGTLMHYPIPIHLQKACAYLGYKKGDFPVAEKISQTCLSLPIYPGLQEGEQQYIIEKIKTFFKR